MCTFEPPRRRLYAFSDVFVCVGVCVVTDTEQIREVLRKGLEFNTKAALPPISSQRHGHERPQ